MATRKATPKSAVKNTGTRTTTAKKVTPTKAVVTKKVVPQTKVVQKKPIVKKTTTAVATKKITPSITSKTSNTIVKKQEPQIVTPKNETVNNAIFPIGKYKNPEDFSDESIHRLIKELHQIPKQLKKLSKQIKYKDQLQLSYRDGGWSIEQIIHHLADSHMNAFVRTKLALTENNPTIKPYNQDLWAETADIQLPIKTSIYMLKAIHKKWNTLWKNMDKNDFERTYTHPEYNTTTPLKEVLAQYTWHGKHHLAQIEVALKSDTTIREVKKEKVKKEKIKKNDAEKEN